MNDKNRSLQEQQQAGQQQPEASTMFTVDDPNRRQFQRRYKTDRRSQARFEPESPDRRSGQGRRTAD